jgi:myo-inositol-1(or 4)-monophosphatase
VTPPSDSRDAAELRRIAVSAALRGAEVARQAFGSSAEVRLKSDRSEVTDIDEAAEQAIAEFLRQHRPSDVLIGEESTERRLASARAAGRALAPLHCDSGVWWIADPIDGTRNFTRHLPCFGCTVACMIDGFPVAGAIVDTMRGVTYSSDGSQLYVAETAIRPQIIDLSLGGRVRRLIVGIPSVRHRRTQPAVMKLLNDCVVRNLGATSLHLAMVSACQMDGSLQATCKLWDIAAGWSLLKAAGGSMCTLDGGAIFPIDPATYAGDELPCVAAAPGVEIQRLL